MTVDANEETQAETADAGELLRGYAAEIEDVETKGDRRWVVARINTDALDSFGTVVDPRGMDRSEYEKNRVVLWEHGADPVRGMVPIGRNDWIKAEPARGVIKAKTVFANDDFSVGLHALYRDDVLRGWSVRGVPVTVGPPTRSEIERRPELEKCKAVYRKWRLKEYSAVAIAGNLDAATEACSRGAWLPEVVRSMVAASGGVAALVRVAPAQDPFAGLPPLVVRRTFDDVLASLERRARDLARREAAEAIDFALDYAKGKV